MFGTYVNLFKVSYEDAESTLQLELCDLQFTFEYKSKFRGGDLLNFYKCLYKSVCYNLQQKACLM
jgi:hypothetical protein